LLYVLFEHQSPVDPLMLFRLLAYMVRIWEAHLKSEPEARRLPAIIPVVLHHSRSGWTAKVAFEDLLDVDPVVLAEIAPLCAAFSLRAGRPRRGE
jgi:predicted transposase YdaD